MEKRILHIQLVHRPRARESEREDRAHCSRLHHWTEGLIIVHTRPLGETPENPASLVALQCTISPTLVRPDPLASDHIATRRTRHEVPRLVGKKSRVFLFYRATPVRIRQGVADRGGYRRDLRLPLGGGESRPETSSAESPWNGYVEDPDGRLAGGTPPARLESEPAEATAAPV